MRELTYRTLRKELGDELFGMYREGMDPSVKARLVAWLRREANEIADVRKVDLGSGSDVCRLADCMSRQNIAIALERIACVLEGSR